MTNTRFQQLFALIASAVASTCDPMGRTGLPVDETGGGGASAGSTTATHASSSSMATTVSASTTTVASSTSGGGGIPTPRRPFLVGNHLRSAESTERGDWQTALGGSIPLLDEPTRTMLAKAWLEDAREEHASVAAFARWSLLMLSASVPPDLVRDSQRASLDEIEHAIACFSLARRYGGVDLGPARLDLVDSLSPLSLVEMTTLAAEEGCVGETLGVAVAMEQLRICEDPVVRGVLQGLVRDEERHAQLAWRFAAWAVKTGGREVLDALQRTVNRTVEAALETPMRVYPGVDLDAWHRHGRLTCEEARSVVREATQSVVLPSLALLSLRPRPPTSGGADLVQLD